VIDVAVCELICQLTSEQFPSGRPAIVDDPHTPLKPEPPPDVDPPPLDELLLDEPPIVLPAVSLPEGAVGLKSFDDCSKAQPVAIVETSTRLEREKIFMCPYSFVSVHTVPVGTEVLYARNSCQIEKACKALQNKGQESR
jgi:hypothetical protein